ncbi:MAG: hypothetical protein ACQEQG_09165 [Bacillota bacterium]
MNTELQKIVLRKDEAAGEAYLEQLARSQSWSLVSFIDELIPGLLFESNLTYSSFHQIKMALFLRRLSYEGKLKAETELKVAGLLLKEMLARNWLNVQAGSYTGVDVVSDPREEMLTELNENNIHNAAYYGFHYYREDPAGLADTLLGLGALSVPDTLSHSLTCFQPVIQDLVYPGHAAAQSAIFSYLSYLNRKDLPHDFQPEDYAVAEKPDLNELLQKAASGSGIINLHHMITVYIYLAWARADYHKQDYPLPYRILLDWFADKDVDKARYERVSNLKVSSWLPVSYQEFYDAFVYDDPEETTRMVINMAEANYSKLVDWMIRLYAEDYEQPRWNPHFYTSVYAALSLYGMEEVENLEVLRMALDQAVRYYLNGMK